jgi:hypothetical protein
VENPAEQILWSMAVKAGIPIVTGAVAGTACIAVHEHYMHKTIVSVVDRVCTHNKALGLPAPDITPLLTDSPTFAGSVKYNQNNYSSVGHTGSETNASADLGVKSFPKKN